MSRHESPLSRSSAGAPASPAVAHFDIYAAADEYDDVGDYDDDDVISTRWSPAAAGVPTTGKMTAG